MVGHLRRETLIFAALIAFLGWWLVDLPPVERAVLVVVAVTIFVAVSVGIERWRQQYLDELREQKREEKLEGSREDD